MILGFMVHLKVYRRVICSCGQKTPDCIDYSRFEFTMPALKTVD